MFDTITNHIHKIGYGVALAIIAYLIFNPRTEYVPIEYEEDVSMRDSTQVESVSRDTVFVRDTVEVELDIPEPTQEDGTQVYETDYSDGFLTATITSRVEGVLLEQDFWYIRKYREITVERLSRTTINRYLKPTRVFEDPNRGNPKGLWGGLQVDELGATPSLTPTVTLFRNNIAYEVGYTINEESISNFNIKHLRVGVKFKIF